MEFGNLIEDELMTNSWMFEDAEPFKWVVKKYDERFIKDRKHFIINEASLLELALNVRNLREHNIKYEKGDLKPILLWLYWKSRETFEKKFKKHLNLGDNLHNQTKNFTWNRKMFLSELMELISTLATLLTDT